MRKMYDASCFEYARANETNALVPFKWRNGIRSGSCRQSRKKTHLLVQIAVGEDRLAEVGRKRVGVDALERSDLEFPEGHLANLEKLCAMDCV
mgnify:FL=1